MSKQPKKPIRALFIDSEAKTVTEIEIVPELKNFYEKIGCEMIEAVYPEQLKGEAIYIDEEGSYKRDNQGYAKAFQITNYGALFGSGIILGSTRGGNDASSKLDLEEVKKLVTFGYIKANY